MSTATLHPVRGARRRIGFVILVASIGCFASPPAAGAYGWPIKPFHAQHPVRGFFGDPRIDDHRNGDRTLHFGIDICAANGTPVYSPISGRAGIHPLHGDVVIVRGDARELSFWHVVPSVRAGDWVTAYRTVVGRVEAPWAHVHLSELRGGVYVNPLRPGGLAPYSDHTRPVVESFGFERAGSAVGRVLRGAVDLVAEVADPAPLPVPGRWHGKPVMPALVRWRILRADGRSARPWRSAIDFRSALPARSFADVYATWTRQNKPWRRARYRVLLARAWETAQLAHGAYRLEVFACDTRGNHVTASTPFVIARRS
jgi:hypothetical protein